MYLYLLLCMSTISTFLHLYVFTFIRFCIWAAVVGGRGAGPGGGRGVEVQNRLTRSRGSSGTRVQRAHGAHGAHMGTDMDVAMEHEIEKT